jgi:acyl phosphate:glycerol-3-phosphate acyltransferase
MTLSGINLFLFTSFAFFCGALPFSVWIGKNLLGRDVRELGDHNPGATNAWKAGGWKAGLLALLLDVSKGAFPVGLAYFIFGWRGPEIIPIALAPVFGHAYSPFLDFKGGKALAVSLGIWIGLLLWNALLIILPPLIIVFLIVDNSGFAVLAALIALWIYLYFFVGNPYFLVIFIILSVLLIWKHREDFRKPFKLRGWINRFLNMKS